MASWKSSRKFSQASRNYIKMWLRGIHHSPAWIWSRNYRNVNAHRLSHSQHYPLSHRLVYCTSIGNDDGRCFAWTSVVFNKFLKNVDIHVCHMTRHSAHTAYRQTKLHTHTHTHTCTVGTALTQYSTMTISHKPTHTCTVGIELTQYSTVQYNDNITQTDTHMYCRHSTDTVQYSTMTISHKLTHTCTVGIALTQYSTVQYRFIE